MDVGAPQRVSADLIHAQLASFRFTGPGSLIKAHHRFDPIRFGSKYDDRQLHETAIGVPRVESVIGGNHR
jgi:hypothetical protein